MGGEPYEIPSALRATSLFKGGSGEHCSPLRWVGVGFGKGERGGVNLCTENRDSPEGGTGGCCRRKKNLFSPLDWGVRLTASTLREVMKMDQTQIARLFGIFAGDDTIYETYKAVLETAALEVEQALKPGADTADARLNWLAAAVGFLRYTQITTARDRAACTFAGTVAQNTDGSQKLRFATLLVQAYEKLCHGLLEETEFLFLAV